MQSYLSFNNTLWKNSEEIQKIFRAKEDVFSLVKIVYTVYRYILFQRNLYIKKDQDPMLLFKKLVSNNSFILLLTHKLLLGPNNIGSGPNAVKKTQ